MHEYDKALRCITSCTESQSRGIIFFFFLNVKKRRRRKKKELSHESLLFSTGKGITKKRREKKTYKFKVMYQHKAEKALQSETGILLTTHTVVFWEILLRLRSLPSALHLLHLLLHTTSRHATERRTQQRLVTRGTAHPNTVVCYTE